MKKPVPLAKNEQHNQLLDYNAIRAARHMLAALSNLQFIGRVSNSEQVILYEIHHAIRSQIHRLTGKSGVQS